MLVLSIMEEKCISKETEHAEQVLDCGRGDDVGKDVSEKDIECERCPIDEAEIKETERDSLNEDKKEESVIKTHQKHTLDVVAPAIKMDMKAVGMCRCALGLSLEDARIFPVIHPWCASPGHNSGSIRYSCWCF